MEPDSPLCPTCGALAGADAGIPASAPVVPIRLTPREATVLAMLRRGLTNDEIAKHIFISRNTVKFHVKQVYRKLGVSSRRRTVVQALDDKPARNADSAFRQAHTHSSRCST